MNSLKNLTYTVLIFATQDASNWQKHAKTRNNRLFAQLILAGSVSTICTTWQPLAEHGLSNTPGNRQKSGTSTGNQSHWLADLLSLLRPECVALLRHRWRVGSAQSLRPGRFRRPQFKCHVQSIQKPDVHQKLQVLCMKLRSPLTCCLIHQAQLSWETPNPWRMSQLGCYLTRKSDDVRNHVWVRISKKCIYIYTYIIIIIIILSLWSSSSLLLLLYIYILSECRIIQMDKQKGYVCMHKYTHTHIMYIHTYIIYNYIYICI